MPVPKFMARANKRFLNKGAIEKGDRPVLTHVGRSSGKTYYTPLDAHRVDGGFIFIVMYGADSDWVQNIISSGTATVRTGDETFDLVSPRLVTKNAAWQQLPDTTKAPPRFLNITEYLQMDIKK